MMEHIVLSRSFNVVAPGELGLALGWYGHEGKSCFVLSFYFLSSFTVFFSFFIGQG